jgi:hypothetical protein
MLLSQILLFEFSVEAACRVEFSLAAVFCVEFSTEWV